MPLLAYTGSGEPLIAPLMSDEAWEELRSTKNRDAWMPQSGRRAIPKVSRLGTRFFAHPPGHAPVGTKESDLHLYLKAQCLIGAAAAGWEALPEQSGKTPDGQDWRADVLCRRPGKAWTVGFEAQVQLQGEAAYRQRQERYSASDIRCLWLVAHEPAALHSYWQRPDQHLPAFKTSTWKDASGRPGAHVHVDGLALSIPDFVAGALSRQLRWYENARHGVVTLILREDQCWHRTCRRAVLLIHSIETPRGVRLDVEAVQAMQGYGEAYAKAQAALPDLTDSPWPFRRVMASRCPHCGRELRYQPFDNTSHTVMTFQAGDLHGSSSVRLRLPIGVSVPEQGSRIGLAPHAGWHWGFEDRWPDWAPLGGIGRVSQHQLEIPAWRRHPKAGRSI